jgi:hypothetical protein
MRIQLVRILLVCALCAVPLGGCARIPAEAPTLSHELGERLTALQAANITLLHRFFDMKRSAVKNFVYQEWLPVFGEQVFADPNIQAVWTKVATSPDAKDKVEFIRRLGPKLQKAINDKEDELVSPLDELEREIETKIRAEYDQAFAINNTLTSFLTSAAEVDANRQRYLDKVGLTKEKTDTLVNQVDEAVGDLLKKTKDLEEKTNAAKEYATKLKDMKSKLWGTTQ